MSIELNVLQDLTTSAFSSRAASLRTIDSELGIILPSLSHSHSNNHEGDDNDDDDDEKVDIGNNHYLSNNDNSSNNIRRRRLSSAIAERDAKELSKPDNSPGAYLFLINAFALEMVIWGK